jgi:hypothetical protein
MELGEHRNFVRHPTDIPIIVCRDGSTPATAKDHRLRDLSHGGLSFESAIPFGEDAVLFVTVPLVKPQFECKARVVWCRGVDDHFEVGVEFIEPEMRFKARMVEQVCQIEHYRREVCEKEGRTLSSREAALEWIKKYAADFPQM